MNKVIRFAACLQIGFSALLAGAAGLPPIYVDPLRGDDGNNVSRNSPEEIAAGLDKLESYVRQRVPRARVERRDFLL